MLVSGLALRFYVAFPDLAIVKTEQRYITQIDGMLHQPAPSGRAVTRLTCLPWSSGHDFRLSLTPISAGDRGSIPRGRVLFCTSFILTSICTLFFITLCHSLISFSSDNLLLS